MTQGTQVNPFKARELAADGLGVGLVWIQAGESREGLTEVSEVGKWFQVFERAGAGLKIFRLELFLTKTLVQP